LVENLTVTPTATAAFSQPFPIIEQQITPTIERFELNMGDYTGLINAFNSPAAVKHIHLNVNWISGNPAPYILSSPLSVRTNQLVFLYGNNSIIRMNWSDNDAPPISQRIFTVESGAKLDISNITLERGKISGYSANYGGTILNLGMLILN
jgi:hypothetical protein